MAKRLTDKKRKQILADYIACQNYREVARKHDVAVNTVKNIAGERTETARLCTQKAEENTQDVLAFMDAQRDTKKRVLAKILAAMEAKAENTDMFTSIKDLATAYGIILDKELRIAEITREKDRPERVEIILRREPHA